MYKWLIQGLTTAISKIWLSKFSVKLLEASSSKIVQATTYPPVRVFAELENSTENFGSFKTRSTPSVLMFGWTHWSRLLGRPLAATTYWFSGWCVLNTINGPPTWRLSQIMWSVRLCTGLFDNALRYESRADKKAKSSKEYVKNIRTSRNALGLTSTALIVWRGRYSESTKLLMFFCQAWTTRLNGLFLTGP